jgi:putative glutamine amidotransferase
MDSKGKTVGIIIWIDKENCLEWISQAYIKAIENTNNSRVILIPANTKHRWWYLDSLEFFMLPWWQTDIDPLLYWEKNTASNWTDQSKDLILIERIKEIQIRNKKLLGICRWMQLINVAFWGTLIQDLPDTKYSFDDIHSIDIKKDSLLYHYYKSNHIMVNSLHHQGIKKLWIGLISTWLNNNWIIEAIESENGNIIGVQRHPEYWKQNQSLFEGFLDNISSKSID